MPRFVFILSEHGITRIDNLCLTSATNPDEYSLLLNFCPGNGRLGADFPMHNTIQNITLEMYLSSSPYGFKIIPEADYSVLAKAAVFHPGVIFDEDTKKRVKGQFRIKPSEFYRLQNVSLILQEYFGSIRQENSRAVVSPDGFSIYSSDSGQILAICVKESGNVVALFIF